jgi:hypothetical protein
LQGGVLFAKAKTDVTGAAFRLMEEAASRNNGNPDILNKIPGKIRIVQGT